MTILEEDSTIYMHSLSQSIQSFNVLQHLKSMPLEGINSSDNMYNGKAENKSQDLNFMKTSLNTLQKTYCNDDIQMNCIVPPYYNVSFNEFTKGSNALHSLIGNDTTKLHDIRPNLSESSEKNVKEKHIPRDIQELIYALQVGGSRCKMEAVISVRSLATSHDNLQHVFIEGGGICPLVSLLKYFAKEAHWPIELRAKATIIVRVEAALALASLSVNNDYNKDVIGGAGAIPLLCELIQFNESNSNSIFSFNYNSQEMAPFLILAQDAGAGALSCLSKSEKNKEAIIATQAISILVHMVDEGTSFGRAAAANVIARLATGEHVDYIRLKLGQEAKAIAPLLRLLKNGSSKAKETAAKALENMAQHDWNKAKILQEGGIVCFRELLENGTFDEQEAAKAAIKVLKTCPSSKKLIQTQENLGISNKTSGICVAERSNQPSRNASEYVDDMDIEDMYIKSMGYKNDTLNEIKKDLAHVTLSTNKHELQYSSTSMHGSIKSPKDSNTWQKSFLEKKLMLPKIQCLSTSELTSTLAPPLVGQPSMQVDAILENTKEPLYSTLPSNKRLKMTISNNNNHISNVLFKKNDLLHESNVQNFNQPTFDSLQLRYSDVNKKNMDQCSWNKNRDPLQQRNQCFPLTEEYGLPDTTRDKQNRQCLVVDKQLVAGGIVALVSALSSPNPNAQEFAALALMLLASQGGFEVKTAISDAGAIPLLLAMIDSSAYPMIRESAAAAIAKLVSFHHVNRTHVLKAGGIKSMVNMARWSTTLIDNGSSMENLKARVHAGAIIAVLNIGNMQDRQNTGMGLRDALPILIHMLESDDFNEVEASVGGIQALSTNLRSLNQSLEVKKMPKEQGSLQNRVDGTISIELITILLYLSRSSSKYAKGAALEALAGFRQNPTRNQLSVFEPRSELSQRDATLKIQLCDFTRQDGVQVLSAMLEKCPPCARESVTAAFAYAMASDKLSMHIVDGAKDEGAIIQQLIWIIEKEPTTATRVSAAAALATIGARKKKLNALSKDHILLLLQILASNAYETSHWEKSLAYNTSSTDNFLGTIMPHILLCEHITAIIVYIALSGDFEKQLLIVAGAPSIFVGVLKVCLSNTQNSTIQESWNYIQSMSKNRRGISGAPHYLHATQEFAIMGLIMLADKNIETMEKIVETGGISLLVNMLTCTVGCKGKLGANWSEMAAAALLTLAGSNNARDEIIRVGGISSLVQVLGGEGGAFSFSLTGLAAMAQLLGVLGLHSEETKRHMAKEGAVKCLVDILIGGGSFCDLSQTQEKIEENLGCVALAQEAAAAALATIVLNCEANAEAAVQAGAVGHLVKLLGPIISTNFNTMDNLQAQDLLPSTYKSMRNEVAASNSDFIFVFERDDSKTIFDEDLVEVGSHVGRPLAAMAALGNMVSCHPQCWHEIVDAGAAPRLANLLKGNNNIWVNGKGTQNTKLSHLRDGCASPTKVQESAALVLDLLIDCEKASVVQKS